jgi:hypothetical protein
MTTNPKTVAHGKLHGSTDTWLLVSSDVIPLDITLLESFDSSLEHKNVSVVGTMGIPKSALVMKLIVEKLASHDAINRRAYEFYESGRGGSATDHWLRAEHDLLKL